ncbi:MAG TPA: Wzz/FepE/Etk N-terminal domain-containing protein [Candidatus Mcinerneyibacteriales bacterium]|nr:Wzz/FepE/Etk N-terminal domain-containing protein [Candidatus Mcinerneyibacteriales bacterium]
MTTDRPGEISLWEILLILARRKGLILKSVSLFLLLGLLIALFSPKAFRASAVIAPTDENPLASSLSRFTNLAYMVGADITSLTGENLKNVKRTLHSADFLFYFNDAHDICGLLGKKEDSVTRILETLRQLIMIKEDTINGTLSIAVETINPELSYLILNKLLTSLNEFIIMKESENSRRFIARLKAEMKATNDPLLRSELSSIWAVETKKIILTRTNQNTLYRVVQSPFVPDIRIRPRRKLIMVMALFLGLFSGALAAFAAEYLSRLKRDPEAASYLEAIRKALRFKKDA